MLAEAEGGHALAPIVAAALALDRGDARRATEEAERYLRRVGKDDRLMRVSALELLVRARLALGRKREAQRAADELTAIAESVGTTPLRAAALLARGRLETDARSELALATLVDAADLYRESGVRAEAAIVRLELGAALRALGREEEALEAETTANAELAGLGVVMPKRPEVRNNPDLLTRRERDVLRRLAQGRSNDEIATELVLSVRTVRVPRGGHLLENRRLRTHSTGRSNGIRVRERARLKFRRRLSEVPYRYGGEAGRRSASCPHSPSSEGGRAMRFLVTQTPQHLVPVEHSQAYSPPSASGTTATANASRRTAGSRTRAGSGSSMCPISRL